MPTIPNDDLLGAKTLAKAVEKAADGIGNFLGKICMPVAEEVGFYFRDQVKAWRTKNAAAIVEKAEGLISKAGNSENKSIHPLLAWRILEQGSLSEAVTVQSFWAGLLASSCAKNPTDGNLIFLEVLSQLTGSQVKLIQFACESVEIEINKHGYLHPPENEVRLDLDDLLKIAGTDDIHQVDIELDRLNNLGLFCPPAGGIMVELNKAIITPSTLCLHLFARCSGHTGDPADFYRKQEARGNKIET